MASQSASLLRQILDELDSDKLEELSDEKVLELRKQLNPYGRVIEGSDNFLTFSYTDLSEKYTKRLLMTSMVGFLNRMNAEWQVPDGLPAVHPYDYVKDPTLLAVPASSDAKARLEYEQNVKTMEKRIVVQEFLEHLFQFDPDEHVRSAYRPEVADPERKAINTPAAKLAVRHLRKTDKKFNAKMEKDALVKSHSVAVDAETPSVEVSDVARHTTEMIPPEDTFFRFTRYMESNYDQLREITNDLYCDKPDLDRAICPHSWHPTREEADQYISKHKDEMIAEVSVAHSGKWNFFAPFEKVRETARYFNEHTVVLEEMLKQIEQDSKLGQDLMHKRVAKKKKKNIEEEGPDAEGFAKWKAQSTTLKDMGASANVVDDECPDDAIEVGVFSFSKGGKQVESSKFYSQAEAPVSGGSEEKSSRN